MNNKVKSLTISAVYVGLGTVAVLCVYPPYYGDWVLLVLLLTFPVTILSLGVMYGSSDSFLIVISIQSIMLILTWLVVYQKLQAKSRRQG
jgi:hypothetical protein